MDRFESTLSTHDDESITVREKDLATEVMGELPFPGALYYLWTGEEPTPGEQRVVDAILAALMVHGTTPSDIAGRMTALTEPDAMQAAVASGILGVGSRYIGTMQNCAEELQAISDAETREEAVANLVAEYRERGEAFPGIGHPHLTTDSRAHRLFGIAESEGVAGEHVDILHDVQARFEAETGRDLPVNVTGAIAALASDIGLSPPAARGLAVISRATGVTATVLEEKENPIATDIWQAVDEQTGPGES